jgi:hypothetical protein
VSITAAAPCSRDGEMVRAAGGRDHAGAERAPAFDRGEADPARGAVHHERLAGAKTRGPRQRAVGGAVGDREPGGDHVVHGLGQTRDGVGRADRGLGEAAVSERRHHPLARRQIGHALAAGIDPARDLHARDEGQRRLLLVPALDDQGVGEIEPRGAHANAHLARARLGHGHVLDDQAAGPAQLPADDRAHDDLALMPERNRSATFP